MGEAARDDIHFEREALCWLPDVTRFALSLTRNEADTDDLVQDTFLIAYEKWAQYAPGTECRAWLFTICRHQFYVSARSSGLEDSFERSEVLAAVEDAVATLPAAYRDVALLVDVHDHSYDSASRILGIPVGTIRSRLFRARRLLQEKLLAHARDAGLAGPRAAKNEGGTIT